MSREPRLQGRRRWQYSGGKFLEKRVSREGVVIKVAIVGATGFIGKAVSLHLRSRGHEIVACVRSPQRGRRALGCDVDFHVAPSGVPSPEALSESDAVLNLAGSPLVGRRWSRRRLSEAEASRVGLTEELVRSLEQAFPRPRVLVSTSAVGYYGDRPEGTVDESSAPGQGYLADLCGRWEEAASRAEQLGVRVVLARFGVVLDRYGGTLEVLGPLFRARLGGRLSSGGQWFPWVHLDDLCRAVELLVSDERATGPFNVVAPHAVRYRDFVESLGKAMGVRAPWMVPAPLLRLVLKEGASALLGGARVEPSRLGELGFEFDHPELGPALEDIFDQPPLVVSEGVTPHEVFGADTPPDVKKRSGILVQSRVAVATPRAQVFDFYSCPYNLESLMPPRLPFEIVEAPERVAEAPEETVVVFRSGKGPLGRRYSGKIFGVEPPRRFFDASHVGAPFRWLHRHTFESLGSPAAPSEPVAQDKGSDSGCDILDDIWIGPPAAKASAGVTVAVARYLFDYRRRVVRRRFGRFSTISSAGAG